MLIDGRALVLGGGGVTGVAWEIGLLHGLARHGVDLSAADTVIGTSAGAAVAAQLTGSTALADIYAAQINAQPGEIPARLGAGALVRLLVASAWPGDRRLGRAWLGRAALRAETMPEAERRAVIERRVPDRRWPDRRLLVTAVDTETGTDVVFDADSGVP